MQIHWTCEGCDQDDETRLEQHWEKVQRELDGKLAALTEVASELRLAVYHEDSGPPWQIHAALHLPGHALVAESRGRTCEESLNRILNELSDRIDRMDETPQLVPLQLRQTQEMLPFLAQCKQQKRSRAFFSFVAPIVETLTPYVQQELQIRERDEVGSNGLTTTDVLDETLLRAWDRFADRAGELPLNLWLVQLVDQVLDESDEDVVGQSLDDEQIDRVNGWVGADQDEWVEQASYPEAIDLAELLPGDGGVDAWDRMEANIKQAHLAEILGEMPRERRQAFVLNLAHGYNAAEIADFQDRTADEVKADIVRATGEVRRAVTEASAPDLQERFDRAKGRDRETRYPRRR